MRVARRALAMLAALGATLAHGAAWAQARTETSEELVLHYQERPPYYRSAPGGQPQGLVITPLRAALTRAGIAHRWSLTPSLRQLALIEQGHGRDCGVGWFRNPAREALGRFSPPLYKDRPIAMLARVGAGLAEGLTMAEAVARRDVLLLTKQGYSYGPLDALIAQRLPPPMSSNGDVGQLVHMLQAGRADWMPVSPEEAEYQLAQPATTERRQALRLYHFSDAPPGQARHLYCNKAVPPALMERLAAALE